jgi:hypothetical protein
VKQNTLETKTETAWGKSLKDYEATPDRPVRANVPYTVKWTTYENIGEVRAANDYPSDEDVVKFLNAKRKNSERTKAMNTALVNAGYPKPTLENDPQLRLRQMYAVLIAAKKTEDEARAIAAATLGVEWDDEE